MFKIKKFRPLVYVISSVVYCTWAFGAVRDRIPFAESDCGLTSDH